MNNEKLKMDLMNMLLDLKKVERYDMDCYELFDFVCKLKIQIDKNNFVQLEDGVMFTFTNMKDIISSKSDLDKLVNLKYFALQLECDSESVDTSKHIKPCGLLTFSPVSSYIIDEDNQQIDVVVNTMFYNNIIDIFAIYTKEQIQRMLEFSNSYNYDMYKTMFKSINIEEATKLYYPIEDLREVFIATNRYHKFSEFKKYILDNFISDMNKVFDYSIDIETVYGINTREIIGINFIFQ